MQRTNASKTTPLPSLVETISQGFGAVNRRLWVLAIPFVLDLLYWLGPRISPQPLIDQVARLLRAVDPEGWETLSEQLGAALAIGSQPINLSLPGFPSMINLLGPRLADLPGTPNTPGVWSIGSFGVLLGVVALLSLLALTATTIYMVALAGALRSKDQPRLDLRRWAYIIGSMLSIALLLIGIMLLVAIPVSIIAQLAALVSPGFSAAILIVGMALLFWLLFTASFSFDAVVMSDVGPLRALLASLYLMQRSFWGAAGLFIVGWLILTGLSLVWQTVAVSAAGLVVAMAGSAYISTGLAAAHLVFYRDRLSRLPERMSRLARSSN